MRLYCATVSALLLVTATDAARAAAPEQEALSLRELAAVIATGLDPRPNTVKVFAGDLPDRERPCSPPGALVLGGYVEGNVDMWIYRVSSAGQEARDACRDALIASKWTAIAPIREAGFRDSDEPVGLCKADRQLVLTIGHTNGQSYLQVISSKFRGKCGERQDSSGESEVPSMVPTLTAPRRSLSQTEASGYSADSYYASQFVSGGGKAGELIRHHLPQLERQGWTRLEESILDQIATIALAKSDTEGRSWRGELVAVQQSHGVSLYLYVHLDQRE